jgi:hypothetical protein
MHDRWFLTPATTNSEGETVPKHADTDGVTGFSGNVVEPATVTDSYPTLTQAHPDISEWYVVRMYGKGDIGYQALNTIHAKGDTRTLAELATDVAPVLSAHFPALDKTPSEWADAFRVE